MTVLNTVYKFTVLCALGAECAPYKFIVLCAGTVEDQNETLHICARQQAMM